MNEVLSTEVIDYDKITKLIHGKCKNKDKIIESLKNSKIESDQHFKMTEIQLHMQELNKHIEATEVEMIKRASRYFNDFLHITEMDGIQLMSAILIISEIGIDMTQFESDTQLCNWARFVPANNEVPKSRNQSASAKQDSISSHCWFNVLLQPLKTRTAILVKNIQESKGEEDTRKPSSPLQE